MSSPSRSLMLLVALLVALLPASPAAAQFGFDSLEPDDGDKIVAMDLVTADGTILAGATEYVGIRLRIRSGWHLYWRNPGDSGTEPKIRVDAPLGVTVGPIAWPRPVVFESPEETTYGYANDVVLLVPVTVPRDFDAGVITLQVEAEWLVCKRACLLGDAKGTVELKVWPTGDNRVRMRENRLADALKRLPTPLSTIPDMAATLIDRPGADGVPTQAVVLTGMAGDAEVIRFVPDLTPGVRAGDGHPVDATIEDGRFRIEVPVTVEPGNALGTPLDVAGLVLFGPRATDRAVSFRVPVTK